jgi:hypothetical protein
MITLAWGIIKTFGPYLLIAMLLGGVYFAGGYAVQRKWDAREAQVRAESKVILDAAQGKADDFKKTTEIAAKIIGETYDQNEKIVGDLTATNTKLLADKLRSSKPRSCPSTLPSNTSATGTSVEAIAPTWTLSEEDATAVVTEDPVEADGIVEDCRAGQTYILSLGVGGWAQ